MRLLRLLGPVARNLGPLHGGLSAGLCALSHAAALLTRRGYQAVRRTAALACMALLAALAACSSPNLAVYTIAVQDGPTVLGTPKIIEMRDVGLAGYLDRPNIVRSSDGYRLAILANDTWGEPLAGMIGRVLTMELAQRLPNSNVYSDRSAISVSADAIVEVNVQRMDVGSDGDLILLAQAAIKFPRKPQPVARAFNIRKPLSDLTTTSEVAAISAALAELADGLAVMLRQ